MAGFSLDISGVKQIEQAIKKMDKAATEGLTKELDAAVINIQRNAIRRAPGNFGKLRQSIKFDIGNKLFKSVFAGVEYAPYVEFGTAGKKKSQVKVPPGYEAFAAQFKGKKTAGNMWKSIELWVKRKGIDPKLTFAIFRSIINKGIPPQPFLIPSYEEEKPKLIKRLKNLFK